jgi:hypothetical protein
MSAESGLFGGLVSTAVLSSCGTYRYQLTRRWADGDLCGWVMLNPSTADADQDDPTIRRCVRFARSWGFAGIVVRNLYALRATDPRALDKHPAPVGPDNDAYLARCHAERFTVCAWGARGAARATEALAAIGTADLRCLSVTKDGQPGHPLYLRADAKPFHFSPLERAS